MEEVLQKLFELDFGREHDCHKGECTGSAGCQPGPQCHSE